MKTRNQRSQWGRKGAIKRWKNRAPFHVRFWDKIKIGNRDECWPWIGSLSKNGYGKIKYKGVMLASHRIAARVGGIKIKGKSVLHHCDNRKCCNPNHLFSGNQKTNIRDAISKGRMEMKISDIQVRQIRRRHKNGENQTKLAKEFMVTQGHISKIVHLKRRV